MKKPIVNIDRISNRISDLREDERLTYKAANIFENAPLAIIQIGLKTELNTLERVLGLKPSKFPLKSKRKKA